MSTKQKGNYYEMRSKAQLENRGYKVERAMPRVLWLPGRRPICTHHDFWGAFDLIGVSTTGSIFVQVKYFGPKMGGRLAETRREIEAFPAPKGSKELHIWRVKEGCRIATLEVETY